MADVCSGAAEYGGVVCCAGEDFSGANLANAELTNANLKDANLSGATIDNANLKYTTMNQADLTAASLMNTDFSYSNLKNADLSEANLSNACLKYVCLDYAQLPDVDATNAILKYAELTGAELTGASLAGADLAYAELPDAILVNTSLNGADLSYTELSNANLTDAEVVDAVFKETEIHHANLTGVDFHSVSLFDALQGLDTAFVESGTLDYPNRSPNDSSQSEPAIQNDSSQLNVSSKHSVDGDQTTPSNQTISAPIGDNDMTQSTVVESDAADSTPNADRIPSDIESVRSPAKTTVNYQNIEIIEEINRGGQAVIYKARIEDHSSPVVALREPVSSTRSISRAQAESFLSNIHERWEVVDNHERNIPRWADFEHVLGVVDSGEKRPWVAIEYVEGGDAGDLLDQHPISIAHALWIGECICKALRIAHECGIKHLDIKPDNVVFKKTGQGKWDWPKLTDWGLARRLATDTDNQDYKSDPYTAPEQFTSNDKEPDQLTDIYQTGATIYALLTGKPPYEGGMVTIEEAILDPTQLPSPSDHREDVPSTLDNIIQKSLERNKANRYRAITDLEDQLINIRSNL